MTETGVSSVLKLVKMDLSISTDKRDEYLLSCINAALLELERRKIKLDDTADDIILLSDYVAWEYRHRDSGDAQPKNLMLRLKNRVIKRRAEDDKQL